MTNPKNISIQDYTYSLPEEKIAKYPLAERDASKLLIYEKGKISEDIYKNIAHYLPENSLLVFNNTKVVAARLIFQKITGAAIEIFCLEPHEQYADITTAMLQKGKVTWLCLVGGVSKWKRGQLLEKKIIVNNKEIILQAAYIEKRVETFVIELSWTAAELSFAEVLQYAGATPLPPYIKRAPEESDLERYQTIYAKLYGSVAAPTAGLHFTDSVFQKLKEKNIQTDFVTLHVGAGTFKPVKSETMKEHDMHAEFIEVPKTFIETLIKNSDNNIIAVGTTSLRTIESLYWLGVKQLAVGSWQSAVGSQQSAVGSYQSAVSSQQSTIGSRQLAGEPDNSLTLLQWEAYELTKENISVKNALQSLLDQMNKNKLERLITKTRILIAPGYSFKTVKGLITNFHQPQSTLLLLVAALVGKDWRKVYDYALQNDFRFLSYGDGSLLWKPFG